jgi:hypothetical protein
MPDSCPTDDWVTIKGRFTPADVRNYRAKGHIEKLSIVDGPRITVELAKAFASLASVKWVWLWRDVTRRALREFLAIPGLRTLDVLHLTPPGVLAGFDSCGLEEFRANCRMSEADVLEVARCRTLRELGAQHAVLSPTVLRAILLMPNLERLDLEATDFDDEMAKVVSTSDKLTSLDLGGTNLTGRGLSHLCKMQQLRSIDLWATQIGLSDVDRLQALPNLEYVSLGNYDGRDQWAADDLLPKLLAIPSLQRLWLDGIAVTNAQKDQLEKRFTSVRLTS